MKVTVAQGDVHINWNDQGDQTGQFLQELVVNGIYVQMKSEQTLRDLYVCLDFLFGRPA